MPWRSGEAPVNIEAKHTGVTDGSLGESRRNDWGVLKNRLEHLGVVAEEVRSDRVGQIHERIADRSGSALSPEILEPVGL